MSRTAYLAAVQDLAELVEEARTIVDDEDVAFDEVFELYEHIRHTADRALHVIVRNAARAGTLPAMPTDREPLVGDVFDPRQADE